MTSKISFVKQTEPNGVDTTVVGAKKRKREDESAMDTSNVQVEVKQEVVEDEETSSPKGKKEKKDKKKKKKEKQEKQEDESMVVEEGASGVCKLIVNLSIYDETTDNSLLHRYIMAHRNLQ